MIKLNQALSHSKEEKINDHAGKHKFSKTMEEETSPNREN